MGIGYMGGSEAIRGYLFQTIIVILDSFIDEDWISFKLEPDIESEKVDVFWIYQNRQKMVQVKSSKNQINIPQVKRWIKELNLEIPNSVLKELRLIGPVSQGTLDLGEFEGVKVPSPKNNDVEGMKSEAAHLLGLFCLKNEIYLYNAIAQEYVVEILISKFLSQSISRNEMKRDTFISLIRHIAIKFPSEKVSTIKNVIDSKQIYSELVEWTKESKDYIKSFQYNENYDFQYLLNLKIKDEFYLGGIAIFFPKGTESYVIQHILDLSNMDSIYCSADVQIQKDFHLSLLEYTAEKDLVFKRRRIEDKPHYEFTKQIFFSEHNRASFFRNLLRIKNVVQFTLSKFLLLFINTQDFINEIKAYLSNKREIILCEDLTSGNTKIKLKSIQDSNQFVFCFIDPQLGRIKIEGSFKFSFIPDLPELKEMMPKKAIQDFISGMEKITRIFDVNCQINQDRHFLIGHVMKAIDISSYSKKNLENIVNAVENVIFRARFAHFKAYPFFYGQNR